MTRTNAISLLLLAASVLTAAGCADPVKTEQSWPALDGTVELELVTANQISADRILEHLREGMTQAETTLGPSGGLGALNLQAGEDYYRIEEPDLYRVLRLALDWARLSQGAYDPTAAPLQRLWSRGAERRPSAEEIEVTLGRVGWASVALAEEARAVRFRRPRMELDFGGVARGFLLDAAARALVTPGSREARLRLGASQLVWSREDRLRSVELEDPRTPGHSLGTLQVANRGIAVVGQPERELTDLLDARTGRPASSDILVAAAIALSAADATAVAEALLVAGAREGGEMLGRTNAVEVILVVQVGGARTVLASSTLAKRFEPSAELAAEIASPVRFILPPVR